MAEPVTDFMAVSFTANLFTFQLKKFEKKCPKSVKRYRITEPLPRRNDASGEGMKLNVFWRESANKVLFKHKGALKDENCML